MSYKRPESLVGSSKTPETELDCFDRFNDSDNESCTFDCRQTFSSQQSDASISVIEKTPNSVRSNKRKTPEEVSVKKVKASGNYQKNWSLMFGLEIIDRDLHTFEVTRAVCRFCQTFGRSASMPTQSTRSKSQNTRIYSFPFRVDNIRTHLMDSHKHHYTSYCSLPDWKKSTYFSKTNSFFAKFAPKRKEIETKTFAIRREIIEDVVAKLFFHEDDEENSSKAKVLDYFQKKGNEYVYSCDNTFQFNLVVDYVKTGISFRQAERLMVINRERGWTEVGAVSQGKVIKYVRTVVALNYQKLAFVLNRIWAFSLAIDCGNNQDTGYLDVRLRFECKGRLENIHLIAIPLRVPHTGKNIAGAISDALNPICLGWRRKVIGLTCDGASANTGNENGALAIIEREIKEKTDSVVYKRWCGIHQLDLLLKKAIKKIGNETFISELRNFSTYLRKKVSFVEIYKKCPAYCDTRWLTLQTMLEWLSKRRSQIILWLQENDPIQIPAPTFWMRIDILKDVVSRCCTCSQSLQGLQQLVSEQKKALSRLADVLVMITGARHQEEEDEIDDDCLVANNFICMERTRAEAFVLDVSDYTEQQFELLTDHERDDLLTEVMLLFTELIGNLKRIRNYRGTDEEEDKEPLSAIPSELILLSSKQFRQFVNDQHERLTYHWSDEDIEQLKKEFKLFSTLPVEDPVLWETVLRKEKEKDCFEKIWTTLGKRFQMMRMFIGGMASVFANTATVESDFSRIKREKSVFRSSMTDLSLEGILQCQDFDRLIKI